MKQSSVKILLIVLMSLGSSMVFAHDIEIKAQSEKPVENFLVFAKELVPLHP